MSKPGLHVVQGVDLKPRRVVVIAKTDQDGWMQVYLKRCTLAKIQQRNKKGKGVDDEGFSGRQLTY